MAHQKLVAAAKVTLADLKSRSNVDYRTLNSVSKLGGVLPEENSVFRSQDDLDAVPYASGLPRVDFQESTAALIVGPYYPCYEKWEVVSVEETADEVTLYPVYWKREVCLAMTSQPMVYVLLPKTSKRVRIAELLELPDEAKPASEPWPAR